ncbi:MAG TPA: 6-phosphofructokinase [Polyangiaceae bacterium]|nr:6-phosphofructokinase [Polyangiaceae bacterium]
MSEVVHFAPPRAAGASDRRLLVVFDGGDAPGYASVAVAITEEGTRRGYEVWAAAEGFRSLTRDATSEPRFERLIVGRRERYALLGQGIPARSMGRRVLDAGSDFRSERYVGFYEEERRREAAEMFRAQGFTHLVCVGGNGTLEGTKALVAELDVRPPTGFVNVSVDDDLAGDRAVGFLSGVEAGAAVARGLLEDAYTHKRIYLLEMMGNRSGRHALHCGVAARAHLVVLPFFRFTDEVLAEIAGALARADYALVLVAEGYEEERRKQEGLSASEVLKRQLAGAGLHDDPGKRVIAEPYSRFVRGLRPSFADVGAAYLKASLLFGGFDEGRTEVVPCVLASHDVGVRALGEVAREDGVEPAFLPLLERLGLPKFQALVRDRFSVRGS